MAPPPIASSSRRMSSAFLSGAISSSASPLQPSFILSCRSPVASPRRAEFDVDARRSQDRRGSSSRYLAPPGFAPIIQGEQLSKSSFGCRKEHSEEGDSESLDDSPTEWNRFLPLASPGLLPDEVPRYDGKLGVLSTINIIVGKTVGVGAYTVPSAIFAGVGSVGVTLTLWVLGSIISFCGLAVYLDLGTAIPKSGGERVYLERIIRHPRMLATCMFMAYAVLLGFSTPNAIVLGDYALYALGAKPDDHVWAVRGVAVVGVSVLCWIHAQHPRLGLQLINVLGFAKMIIIIAVVCAGITGGLMGIGGNGELWKLRVRRLDLPMSGQTTAQRNFSNVWAGSSTQPYDYATGLLKVIYCFRGYSTANQVLSDVRNPIRTLRIAAPIALALVSLTYVAINIAFLLVVEKDDFRSAGVVVAGLFFRNVFGVTVGSHILPIFVIISAAGNIAATSFAQARVNEELARDGLLPWSKFWTTSPKETAPPASPAEKARRDASDSATPPSRGLLLHWAVSVAAIVLPPGHIYAFLVDLGGYPVGVISAAISFGLLYLHLTSSERWVSPCRANLAAIIVFAAANALLLILPWIPPSLGSRGQGGNGEEGMDVPYFAYPATSLLLLISGAVYWCYWRKWGNGKPSKKRAWSARDQMGGEMTTELMDDGEESSAPWMTVEVRRRAKCGCPCSPEI